MNDRANLPTFTYSPDTCSVHGPIGVSVAAHLRVVHGMSYEEYRVRRDAPDRADLCTCHLRYPDCRLHRLATSDRADLPTFTYSPDTCSEHGPIGDDVSVAAHLRDVHGMSYEEYRLRRDLATPDRADSEKAGDFAKDGEKG